MICTRKYPFCLGGTVPPASEWPKLGGAKQGDQGPCWSHQQPPVFAFFGKSSHDFLTSCYLHFFASLTQTCQVQWFESILDESMNRSPFLLSKVFSWFHPFHAYWLYSSEGVLMYGATGIFFGGWRQDKAYPSLVWSGITSAFCPAPPNPPQTGPAPPTHCLSTQLITHLVPDVCSRQQNPDDWSILTSSLSVASSVFFLPLYFFLCLAKGTRGLFESADQLKNIWYI